MVAAEQPDLPFGISITCTPSKEVDRFLAILEELMPVHFGMASRSIARSSQVLGHLCVGRASETAVWRTTEDKPTLQYLMSSTTTAHAQGIQTRRVSFTDHPEVPFPFRNREILTEVPDINPVVPKANESILATDDRGPLWAVSVRYGAKHFRTAFGLRGLQPHENFVDVFRAERFLEVLTLLHFLRVAGERHVYATPPLRAAFMFDDPNLHWPTYGCIDFREVAIRARRSNFHVAFATIPLDSWFTHRTTAQLFHDNSKWLSLLIHGNNHAKRELAIDSDAKLRSALLRQALARIEKLEATSKLQVCRVMVPPHGACSVHMLAALPQYGYEGACISPGSLIATNATSPWTSILGFAPAELIEGCAVLPRDGLGGNLKNSLLLNAYLGRPLIVRGHHGDLKGGVEVLDDLARFINGLGEVTWSRLSTLIRSSYQYRLSGTDCRLLPLASTVDFSPPPGARTLTLQGPIASLGTPTYLVSDAELKRMVKVGESFEITGTALHIRQLPPDGDRVNAPATPAASLPKTAPSLLLRRALTEVRDRLLRI